MLVWLRSLLLILVMSSSSSFAFTFSLSIIPSSTIRTVSKTTNTRQTRTTVGGTATRSSSTSPTLLWAAVTNKQKKKETSSSSSFSIASLQQWASETAGIKTSPTIQLKDDKSGSDGGGRGWYTTTAASSSTSSSSSSSSSTIQPGALLLTVPANVALTVECPGLGPDDASIRRMLGDNGRQVLKQLPWFVQMALYLYKLDQVDSFKNDNAKLDMRTWLDSLPRKSDFNTPIHWTTDQRRALQYDYMEQSVAVQEAKWKKLYNTVQAALVGSSSSLSYDDFVWYCECARSRAFSSSYTGAAFSPTLYAFTLLLVAIYVGLGIGTLEQAANGAGVVFCVAVLKDFVVPKLFAKSNRLYVMAPMMDMANHKSSSSSNNNNKQHHHQAQVSFEYFGNTYSLATVKENKDQSTSSSSSSLVKDNQVYISYGERTNDQLLQFYGFVEPDNPFDVYIMPPLREWNITALERVVAAANPSRTVGSSFAPGRLQKLDMAGLLGSSSTSTSTSTRKDTENDNDNDDNVINNEAGGIVVTRQTGMDPAVIQALRALVSTEQEWTNAGQAVASFAEYISAENEACARLVAKTAIEMELQSKQTSLQEDQELLRLMLAKQSSSLLDASPQEILAVRFRIEKKKLLLETMDKLR